MATRKFIRLPLTALSSMYVLFYYHRHASFYSCSLVSRVCCHPMKPASDVRRPAVFGPFSCSHRFRRWWLILLLLGVVVGCLRTWRFHVLRVDAIVKEKTSLLLSLDWEQQGKPSSTTIRSVKIPPFVGSPGEKEEKEASLSLEAVRLPGRVKPQKKLPAWLNETHWKDKTCIPYAKWQVDEFRPSTCNLFHELDVAEPGALEFIACGGARCAYSLTNHNALGRSEKVVLKWTKGAKFDPLAFQSTMKDTMAMERLQSSYYVLKMYGNCGASQMIEAGTRGALYDQMVIAKNTENALDGLLNNPESNLRVSYHLARALADVHSIDGSDFISFVHNDVDSEQFIFTDGVFKLNDFHYASKELQNRTSGSSCATTGVRWSTKHTKLRAPEEFLPRRGNKIHRDQVDVWMLGGILYYVLTKKWIMEGRTNREVAKLYSRGKLSEIPSFIKESKNPAHQAMIHALHMAWVHNPVKRASAREIAEYLEGELIVINGGKSDWPWRVSARTLPEDYEIFEDPKNKISSFISFYDNYRDFSDD